MGIADLVEHLAQNYKNYLKRTAGYALVSTVAGVVGGLTAGYYVAAATGKALYTSLASIGGFFITKEAIYIPGHLYSIYEFLFGKGKKEEKKAPAPAPAGNLVPALAT